MDGNSMQTGPPRTRPWVSPGSASMQVAGWQFRRLPHISRLRGEGEGVAEWPTTQHVNETQYLHSSQSLSSCWRRVCVLLALCHRCCLAASHDTLHCCRTVVATVSATTVKSQLVHPHTTFPSPPLAFPLGLRYRDNVIWIATIIDVDFLSQYNPYVSPINTT